MKRRMSRDQRGMMPRCRSVLAPEPRRCLASGASARDRCMNLCEYV